MQEVCNWRSALEERFPSAEEVALEAQRPIPPLPFQRGGMGLTRLELLLLQAARTQQRDSYQAGDGRG